MSRLRLLKMKSHVTNRMLLATLHEHLRAAGRDPSTLEWIGGVRGRFPDDRSAADLDEALADVPGVYVANRYNFSVDQRLSVRGAGARANFGVRGVRVLLDGVPQTLPDGQSQLTNVDLANLERVEVLRGNEFLRVWINRGGNHYLIHLMNQA